MERGTAMPHERIVGVHVNAETQDGQQIFSGTAAVDIYWGKGLEGIQFGLSLLEDEVPLLEGETPESSGERIRPLPEGHTACIGSWSQINNMLRVLKRARNDAYGTPE
jgi:hypothetical protein